MKDYIRIYPKCNNQVVHKSDESLKVSSYKNPVCRKCADKNKVAIFALELNNQN